MVWSHVEQQRIFAGAVELAGYAFKLKPHLRGCPFGLLVGALCADLQSVHAQLAKAPSKEAAHHPVRYNVFRIQRQFCRARVVHRQHKPAAQHAVFIEHPDGDMGHDENGVHALFYPLRHRCVVAEQ